MLSSSGVLSAVFLALLCANGALSLPAPFDDGQWHPSSTGAATSTHGKWHSSGAATSTLAATGTGAAGAPGSLSTAAVPSGAAGSAGGSMDDPTSTDLSDPTSTGVPASSSGNSSSSSGVGKAPYFVVYNDRGPDPAPDVSKIQGFNVVALSFILSTGPADMALAWKNLPASQRSSIKQKYKEAGVKLIVSAFGSTEEPTTKGLDAKQIASTMAQYVKQYDLDGIDVDYEDLDAMNKADGKAEQWLEDFTTALRAELPKGQYILTHAPMAPWMGDVTSRWKSGAYVAVNKKVGDQIDWYNVQFYNQGTSEYTTCDGLLTKSTSANPKSSLFEIVGQGFDLNKLVIGKPAAQTDASNGQMSASTLATCLQTAKQKNWNAGAMSWQYPNANAQWIQTVRGSAFGGSSSNSSTGSTGDDSSMTGTGASAVSSATGGAGAFPTSTDDGDDSSATATSDAAGAFPTDPADSTSGAAGAFPTDPADSTSDAAGATPTGTAGGDDSDPTDSDPTDTDSSDSTSDSVIGTGTATAALGGASSPSSILQGGEQGSSWSQTFSGTVPTGAPRVRRYSRLNQRRYNY